MRQLVIEAPGPVAAPVRKVGLVSTPTGPVQVVASDLRVTPARVAGGYDMEILVRASDLGLGSWPLDAGARIGLDVAINVARGDVSTGDCPPRLGQLYLHTYEEGGTCWQPWCDVRALCAPEVVATP